MADVNRLIEALRAADAAGDTEAAAAIAESIRAADVPRETEGTEEPYTGTLLPFSKDAQGNVSFDTDAGIIGPLKRAFTLPGEVYKGEIDPRSEEGIGRALEGAAVMAPIGAASRVKGSLFAPKRAYKAPAIKAPTRKALQEAADAGYRQIDDLGVEYDAHDVAEMAGSLREVLESKLLIDDPEIAASTHALLKRLQAVPADPTDPSFRASVSLPSLDAFRKILGDLAGSTDKQKVRAASKAIRAVDDFIRTARPTTAMDRTAAYGPPTVANANAARDVARTIEATRGNAAAGFRSDEITGLENTIRRRTAAANSGRNLDNTIRQRLASALDRPKTIRGFNDAELQAMDDIVMGSPTKNAAREVGNRLGGGGGVGNTVLTMLGGGVGAGLGGTPGAIIGAGIPGGVGALSRAMANRMSKRELRRLDELIRMRSPLAKTVGKEIYAPGVVGETMLKALAAPRSRGRRIYDDGRS